MGDVVAIIQARTGSSRFPGKVLFDLAGKPVLAHVIDRAQRIPGVQEVIVATTILDKDDPVVALAQRYGAAGARGSETDVLDRFYQAARPAHAKVVVRLTGDCPLLDPEVSGQVLARFLLGDADYVSNVHPPSYPDGLDTEVLSFGALERAWREANLPSEREHVTPYIWKNQSARPFRLANVSWERDLSSWDWVVDTKEDLSFLRAIAARQGSAFARASWRDVLHLLEEDADIRKEHPSHFGGKPAREAGYARSLEHDAEWLRLRG